MGNIVVFGSANVDYVVPVKLLPVPGETVLGADLVTVHGGKGANQAVAAARLGGAVEFVGKVGTDGPGDRYLEHLRSEGVGTGHVGRCPERPSGSALILVEERGQNMIVVAAGANGAFSPEEAEAARELVRKASVVLVQFEIPLEAVRRVVELANEEGAPVMMNPSPVSAEFQLQGLQVDYLVVNAGEAEVMSGMHGETRESLEQAGRKLLALGVRHVIVTRGVEETLVFTSEGMASVETFPVTPVDTVGAGDTFAGALAVGISEGMEILKAVRLGNCAAALSTTALGAQASMPRRSQVEELLTTTA